MKQYKKDGAAIESLTPEQYRVTQQSGTERPGSGKSGAGAWSLKNVGKGILSGKDMCVIEHLPHSPRTFMSDIRQRESSRIERARLGRIGPPLSTRRGAQLALRADTSRSSRPSASSIDACGQSSRFVSAVSSATAPSQCGSADPVLGNFGNPIKGRDRQVCCRRSDILGAERHLRWQ